MSSQAEAIAKALRGDVPALRRMGVMIRVPWWRWKVQRRLAPRRFRLWAQTETLRQMTPGG